MKKKHTGDLEDVLVNSNTYSSIGVADNTNDSYP